MLLPRFKAKFLVNTNGCWDWTGCSTDGYGYFWLDGRMQRACRVAYEALVGPIAPGLQIDHLCRNRRCVNPAHLEPVTQRENVLRGEGLAAQQVRRTHCPRGHPYDEENTRRIKSRPTARYCQTCHREETRARRAKARLK